MQRSLGASCFTACGLLFFCRLSPEKLAECGEESHRSERPVCKAVVLYQCIAGCQHPFNEHSSSFCQGCIQSRTLLNWNWDDSRWTNLTLCCIDQNTVSCYGFAGKLSLVLAAVESTMWGQKDQVMWSNTQFVSVFHLQGQKSRPAVLVPVQKQEDWAKHDLACPRHGHDSVPRNQRWQALLLPSSNSNPGPAGETATFFHSNRVICRKIRRNRWLNWYMFLLKWLNTFRHYLFNLMLIRCSQMTFCCLQDIYRALQQIT